MQTKICIECKQELPVTQFAKSREYVRTRCKPCYSAYQKRYYELNKDRHKERAVRSKKRVRLRNIEFLFQYLLKHPCVDCGETNPLRLEFDHVRGEKVEPVSHMYNKGLSFERILSEIEKCEVRCANCHRERTARTQDWKMVDLWDEYNKG